jgi:phenylpyruvate tautomerase PptA (4-oxalocrotonate tautomerase family)
MPYIEISTNTSIANCQTVAEQASKLTAELLGKPESYVMVKILPEQALIFAGSNEPAAHIKLKSLGLPENNTSDFSEKICSFMSTQLNVDSARMYIEFSNPERHMWGWDKKTF